MRGTRFPNVENVIHAIFKLTDGQIVLGTVGVRAGTAGDRAPDKLRVLLVEGARGTFTTKPSDHGNEDTPHLLP
jgi:hypothetical protein